MTRFRRLFQCRGRRPRRPALMQMTISVLISVTDKNVSLRVITFVFVFSTCGSSRTPTPTRVTIFFVSIGELCADLRLPQRVVGDAIPYKDFFTKHPHRTFLLTRNSQAGCRGRHPLQMNITQKRNDVVIFHFVM